MSSGKPEQYYGQSRPEMRGFVPDGARRVLEVGCGAGGFSSQLRQPGRELWGIELDATAAEAARGVLDHVLCGDIDALLPTMPAGYFDAVIFNDVLEHMVDPYGLLQRLRKYMAPGGVVVASIPNVRYFWHVKEFLVEKQWRYRNFGIMDRTHLRFFTESSIRDLFEDAGYDVICLEGINGFRSWKFSLLATLLAGHIADMRFEQFGCVARIRGVDTAAAAP